MTDALTKNPGSTNRIFLARRSKATEVFRKEKSRLRRSDNVSRLPLSPRMTSPDRDHVKFSWLAIEIFSPLCHFSTVVSLSQKQTPLQESGLWTLEWRIVPTIKALTWKLRTNYQITAHFLFWKVLERISLRTIISVLWHQSNGIPQSYGSDDSQSAWETCVRTRFVNKKLKRQTKATWCRRRALQNHLWLTWTSATCCTHSEKSLKK